MSDRPAFRVETLDDLRRLIVSAQGGDPEAQQTINNFLKFNNNIERSNLPTTRAVLALAQLSGFGRLFYPEDPDNPFNIVADSLAIAFMAKGGDKSRQFVELMKQTPTLAELQTGMPSQPSLRERIFGKRSSGGET